MSSSFQDLANFIWSVADLLRGPYRPPQYECVMLPMTVLRRFDCVLEPTQVKERHSSLFARAVMGQLPWIKARDLQRGELYAH